MARNSWSANWVRLSVEALEERCVLSSWLVEDYAEFTLQNANGQIDTCDGEYHPTDQYIADADYTIELNPAHPEPKSSFSAAETAVLTARFPDWTFVYSTNTLTDDSLIVRDYQVFVEEGEGLGADIWVEYQPIMNFDPFQIHWIQIVTTNYPTGGVSPFVDLIQPETGTTPYYDDNFGWANNTGFTDEPGRSDTAREYEWSATLLVVEEMETPKSIIIWQGLSWSWETQVLESQGGNGSQRPHIARPGQGNPSSSGEEVAILSTPANLFQLQTGGTKKLFHAFDSSSPPKPATQEGQNRISPTDAVFASIFLRHSTGNHLGPESRISGVTDAVFSEMAFVDPTLQSILCSDFADPVQIG